MEKSIESIVSLNSNSKKRKNRFFNDHYNNTKKVSDDIGFSLNPSQIISEHLDNVTYS